MQELKNIIQKLGDTFNNPQVRETHYFDFYHDDLIIYGFPSNLTPNKDGFKNFIHMLWNAFPDIRITFEDTIAEQNKIACRYYLSGTHGGEFLHRPPTNKKFKVHGMTIFAFEKDVIKQRWNVLDVLELIDQIKETSS